MPKYEAPSTAPESPREFQIWMLDELRHISDAVSEIETDEVLLKEWNVEPEKLYNGLVAYADGTNWNPGSGRGVYAYQDGAWVKLGGSAGVKLCLESANTPALPALAFGDCDTGFFEPSDDQIGVSINGILELIFDVNGMRANVNGGQVRNVNAGSAVPTLIPNHTDPNTGISSAGPDILSLLAGGIEAIRQTEAGGEVLVENKAKIGQIAHIGSSQGDGPIESSYNVYSLVANAGDAATLPATFRTGMMIFVKNDGSNSMDLFPASGDNIIGLSVNTPVAIPNGRGLLLMGTLASATWTRMLDF